MSYNTMKNTRYLTTMGLLLALACGISFLETLLPLPLPLGVKPGLSSIVVMYVLLFLDAPSAWLLTVLKSGFVFLNRGVTAGIMSLSGGIVSLCVMLLLLRLLHCSTLLMSISGAISHNLGQLLVAMLLLQTPAPGFQLPVLLLAGWIAGTGTGLCFQAMLPAFRRIARLQRKGFGSSGK